MKRWFHNPFRFHEWGPWRVAVDTDQPYRRCQVCGFVDWHIPEDVGR